MSENLDLVRSLFADWGRGDWTAPVTWADSEIELVGADGPDPFSVSGVANMAATFREFLSTWDGLRSEAQEFRELDDERILVYVHNTGRGKGSGMEVGHLIRGRVVKIVLYWDRNRALADLGLAE